MRTTSRFAPSPTGYLHLGHAYSAWLGRSQSDIWRLRFEDIDTTRCKREFIVAAQEDLVWLGLAWEGSIRIQSEHFADYRNALEILHDKGLLYPCFCTRSEIAEAQAAPHSKGAIYPGICRNLSNAEIQQRQSIGKPFSLRINMEKACRQVGPQRFFEIGSGWTDAAPCRWGDVVLARKDTPTSYHLCVVHDDSVQGISHVIRGEDLRESTHLHVLLQALLGYDTPCYQHHRLITGHDGQRLAKRNNAVTLRKLRESGLTGSDVLRQLETIQWSPRF